MPNPVPVAAPANYAPVSAVGYAEPDSTLSPVSADKPLPVNLLTIPAPTPLSGTAAASTVAGPFTPTSARPVILSLSGTWSGTARLLRSTDGGINKLPLTAAGLPWGQYSANCCEPAWEETAGAALYLDIALSSGTLTYRVAQ